MDSSANPVNRRRRRVLASSFLGVFVFVVLGYFSNVMSLSSAESATDGWVKGKIEHATWVHKHASHEPAEFTWPWIVRVKYSHVVGPLGGEWGTRYYLSILGFAVPVRNRIELQS